MPRPFLYKLIILLSLLSNSEAESQKKQWPSISGTPFVQGISKPTHITHAGDGTARIFITEQEGRILVIKGGKVLPQPFLDIKRRVSCCGERGLLSVVFPSDFTDKKYFYINYTDLEGDTVIARYRVTSDPDRADPQSEEVILTIKQPYANHNGGQMAFGLDGFLYIGMGDGGSAGDPHKNAQNPASLLGKILRIDVEARIKPYAIPAGNPFLKKERWRPEIWAYGLRNPWRFSFDRRTGDLFIGDVGQDRFEEVDLQPAESRGGENYGWNIMEAGHCFKTRNCDRQGLIAPISEYPLENGNCSVIGGFVYRGKSFPSMEGIYLFADYCSGRIWGLKQNAKGWEQRLLLDTSWTISTFGEDEQGELYVADHGNGIVYRIVASVKK